MQQKIYTNFIRSNLYGTVIGMAVLFAFSSWQKNFFSNWYFFLPIYGFLLNILVYQMVKRMVLRGNLQLVVSSLFGIKLFGYLVPIIVALLLKLQKETILLYVLLVFMLYIIFTVIITRSVLIMFNSTSIRSDNSK